MKKLTKEIIVDRVNELITETKSELDFANNYELLIAVMLSAQCTDKRVNIITKQLFDRYPTCYDLASADIQEVESIIKSCNYFRNKAKNIIAACDKIVNDFGGEVPSSHESLISLPGVGNKTANVVQAVGFGMQAFAVDTHIKPSDCIT